MPLSQPKTIFGIHSVTPYNITTREFLGTTQVVGSCELSSEGELIPLNGGSSKYPWKVERGLITAEISLTLKEYPNWIFEALVGKAITENSAESGGSVVAIANANGTSVVASTGIASVGVKSGDETDVKFAGFVVKAVSATTVDVYASTNLDFANGTDKTFEDDLLKITASPLTITTSTAVEIPDFGVELTGGAGTIAMTSGDTAVFSSRPINTESQEVVVGSSTEVFNDFGLIITGQRAGDKFMTALDCYKVAAAGLPINFTENAFSEYSVTAQLYRDTTRDGIYKMERVQATN
jgi:hypothetical protein